MTRMLCEYGFDVDVHLLLHWPRPLSAHERELVAGALWCGRVGRSLPFNVTDTTGDAEIAKRKPLLAAQHR